MQSSKECVRLRDALKCIGMHLGGYIYSHVEMLKSKAAEKQTCGLSPAVRSRLTVPTAGHERKHNACRAEVGGCVSGYTYIRRIRSPQNVCGSLSEDSTPAQANTRPRRLVTGALRLSVAGVRRQEVVGRSVAGR